MPPTEPPTASRSDRLRRLRALQVRHEVVPPSTHRRRKHPETPDSSRHRVSQRGDSPSSSTLILYRGDDQRTRIQVRLEGGTVWLSQRQLAELYQTSVPNINQHLAELYEEDELDEGATIKRYLIVRREGTRDVEREVLHYNRRAYSC